MTPHPESHVLHEKALEAAAEAIAGYLGSDDPTSIARTAIRAYLASQEAAAPSEEPTIRAGEYYQTRNGRIVGPMAWDAEISVWRDKPDFVRNTGDYWHFNGSRMGHCEDALDLVAFASPAVAPVAPAMNEAGDVPENIIDNPKSWIAWKREAESWRRVAERLETEKQEAPSEPVAWHWRKTDRVMKHEDVWSYVDYHTGLKIKEHPEKYETRPLFASPAVAPVAHGIAFETTVFNSGSSIRYRAIRDGIVVTDWYSTQTEAWEAAQ